MFENTDATALTRALRAAAEAFLASLDNEATVPSSSISTNETISYDPLNDEPPFAPNPQPGAPEAERRLAAITYLGAIGRINAEHGRGAKTGEISEYAKKAGYSGGNAVNGWNSRTGSPRAVEMVDGGRFLNSDGLAWILKDAKKLGIEIAGQIATVPTPTK